MAEKRQTMRKSSSLSSPLLLLCLLTARCCHGVEVGSFGTRVGGGPAGRRCAGRYVTVADTTSFPIAGCYRRTSNHDHGNAFSYANYEEKVVEGVASQPMVMWNSHGGVDESPWGIGEIGEHPSAMCTSRAQGWECNDGATFTFDELVTCGCSASEQQASERQHSAWVAAQGGADKRDGALRGSSSGRRHSTRGGGGRDNGVPPVAGVGAGVGVSRALDNGEFHSFWMWVIIAGGIAGLIVLCCIGWYIRNPFFCQKAPPADPNVQAEDAAPQAPKTAFQPWGASAPPK